MTVRHPEAIAQLDTGSGTTTLTSANVAPPASPADDIEESGRPADRQLGERCRRALATDAQMRDVPVDRVRLSAENHRVRLRGVVPTIADKQRVREVKEVEAVDNEIVILH